MTERSSSDQDTETVDFFGYRICIFREPHQTVPGKKERKWCVEIEDSQKTPLTHDLIKGGLLFLADAQNYSERIVRKHATANGLSIPQDDHPQWKKLKRHGEHRK